MEHSFKSHSFTRRLFIAVKAKPDQDFLSAYTSIRNTLKEEQIRWVNPENFHITLCFLGETDAELIPWISEAVRSAAERFRKFGFLLSGTGVFRSISYPRVLWLGASDYEILTEVKLSIDKNLGRFMAIEEENGFHPHLTLGRMKRINNPGLLRDLIREYQDHTFLKITVGEIILYESRTLQTGPVYTALDVLPLAHPG